MEQDALILRILEGKRVAKRCAGDILAWVADSQAFPFAALEEYIRNKFLLLPEDIRERNLLKLAKISVVRTSGLAKEHAWAADGKDCAGGDVLVDEKGIADDGDRKGYGHYHVSGDVRRGGNRGRTCPSDRLSVTREKGIRMNIHAVRADFPILSQSVNGKKLVYLDNAATSQKPKCVLDAVTRYYAEENANVHRGIHTLSNIATGILEDSRQTVARFINAEEAGQIVFTSGATDALNAIATGVGETLLHAGDEVLVTAMEHHANFVPWLMLCKRKGASLKIASLDEGGHIDEDEFARLLTPRVKLVALSHMSNVTGTVNPLERLLFKAREAGAVTVVDGAQGVVHQRVDVRRLDCDFYCFSAHKLYALMGVGVLYGKKAALESMQPFRYGGEMVDRVTGDEATFAELPYRLEAGTPNVGGACALAESMRYIESLGRDEIYRREHDLCLYCRNLLEENRRVRIVGDGARQTGILSFTVEGVHSYDLAFFLDGLGVAVRSGHHCAQVLHRYMGLDSTIRASFAFYNTQEEIHTLVDGVDRFLSIIGRER